MGRRKRISYVGCPGFSLFKIHCESHFNVQLWGSEVCKWHLKYISTTTDPPVLEIYQLMQRLDRSITAQQGCRRTCLLSNCPALLLVWHFVFLFLSCKVFVLSPLSSCACSSWERYRSSSPDIGEGALGHDKVDAKPISLGMQTT